MEIDRIEYFKTYLDNYVLSKCGKVYSLKTNKLRKFNINNKGYKMLSIKDRTNKIYKNISVHRFMAMTFLKNENNYKVVNHKDGDKNNNNISNLEWCTQKENINHSWANGMSKYSKKNRKYIPVYCIVKESGERLEFESVREAARKMNVNQSNLLKLLKGEVGKCGNYDWGYLNEN